MYDYIIFRKESKLPILSDRVQKFAVFYLYLDGEFCSIILEPQLRDDNLIGVKVYKVEGLVGMTNLLGTEWDINNKITYIGFSELRSPIVIKDSQHVHVFEYEVSKMDPALIFEPYTIIPDVYPSTLDNILYYIEVFGREAFDDMINAVIDRKAERPLAERLVDLSQDEMNLLHQFLHSSLVSLEESPLSFEELEILAPVPRTPYPSAASLSQRGLSTSRRSTYSPYISQRVSLPSRGSGGSSPRITARSRGMTPPPPYRSSGISSQPSGTMSSASSLSTYRSASSRPTVIRTSTGHLSPVKSGTVLGTKHIPTSGRTVIHRVSSTSSGSREPEIIEEEEILTPRRQTLTTRRTTSLGENRTKTTVSRKTFTPLKSGDVLESDEEEEYVSPTRRVTQRIPSPTRPLSPTRRMPSPTRPLSPTRRITEVETRPISPRLSPTRRIESRPASPTKVLSVETRPVSPTKVLSVSPRASSTQKTPTRTTRPTISRRVISKEEEEEEFEEEEEKFEQESKKLSPRKSGGLTSTSDIILPPYKSPSSASTYVSRKSVSPSRVIEESE